MVKQVPHVKITRIIAYNPADKTLAPLKRNVCDEHKAATVAEFAAAGHTHVREKTSPSFCEVAGCTVNADKRAAAEAKSAERAFDDGQNERKAAEFAAEQEAARAAAESET